jgi:hypothetical protein
MSKYSLTIQSGNGNEQSDIVGEIAPSASTDKVSKRLCNCFHENHGVNGHPTACAEELQSSEEMVCNSCLTNCGWLLYI